MGIEEVRPPQIEDFAYISDHACKKTDIVKMESTILNALGFRMMAPTTWVFLQRYQLEGKIDVEVCQLSSYLAELTLLSYSCLKFRPSCLAASVVALGLHTLECTPWNSKLERLTGFSLADPRDCMQEIMVAFNDVGSSPL